MKKGYSIFRNFSYIFVGWIVPNVVNLLAVPYVVKNLGYDEYGIWSLVMAVVGYLAFLDMNLAKGAIRYLAEHNHKEENHAACEVMSFGLFSYFIIGLLGWLAVYIMTEYALLSLLKIPDQLFELSRSVFHLAGFGFFVNMIQSYLASIPKAVHRFDINTKIEVTFNILTTSVTVLVLYMGFGLQEMIWIRIVSGCLNSCAFSVAIIRLMPYLKLTKRVDHSRIRKLLSFSVYSLLSRIGSTSTSQLTKVVIGGAMGTTAVTFFAVPYMAATRLMSLSNQLCYVIFPISSELGSVQKFDELHKIYLGLSRYVFFVNVVMTTIISICSYEILHVWMGEDFAIKSSTIFALVAIGIFFDLATSLPSLVNDGLSYPSITGYFSILRGIIGVASVWVGAKYFGADGIGWAFMLSAMICSVGFNIYVHKVTIRFPLLRLVRKSLLSTSIVCLLIWVGWVGIKVHVSQEVFDRIGPSYMLGLKLLILTTIFFVAGYTFILDKNIRKGIWRKLITRAKVGRAKVA